MGGIHLKRCLLIGGVHLGEESTKGRFTPKGNCSRIRCQIKGGGGGLSQLMGGVQLGKITTYGMCPLRCHLLIYGRCPLTRGDYFDEASFCGWCPNREGIRKG